MIRRFHNDPRQIDNYIHTSWIILVQHAVARWGRRFFGYFLRSRPVETWDQITERSYGNGEILTEQERDIIYTNKCPDCGGIILYGPEGAGSQNIRCATCDNRFSWSWVFGERSGERLLLVGHNKCSTS